MLWEELGIYTTEALPMSHNPVEGSKPSSLPNPHLPGPAPWGLLDLVTPGRKCTNVTAVCPANIPEGARGSGPHSHIYAGVNADWALGSLLRLPTPPACVPIHLTAQLCLQSEILTRTSVPAASRNSLTCSPHGPVCEQGPRSNAGRGQEGW